MIECPTCLAAEHASDGSKETLLRQTHLKLDQARAELLPVQVENGRLRDRIRELEEIVRKQNKALMRGRRTA